MRLFSRIYFILFVGLITGSVEAQQLHRQVFAIGGSSFQSPDLHINQTIGEPVIGAKSLGDIYYSQGFQQVDQLNCTLTPLVTSLASVSCPGGDDGWAKVVVNGGIGPFAYLWNDGSSVSDRSGLGPGVYMVTVSDASGCSASGSTFIIEPDTFALQIDSIRYTTIGLNDGLIEVTMTGGSSPYSFNWTGPNGFNTDTEDVKGLAPGDYQLVVTDSNGCDGLFDVTVEIATATREPAWLKEIRYWPNPVGDELNLQVPMSLHKQIEVRVINVLGRVIRPPILWSNNEIVTIKLQDVLPGILQVVLIGKDQVGSILLLHHR